MFYALTVATVSGASPLTNLLCPTYLSNSSVYSADTARFSFVTKKLRLFLRAVMRGHTAYSNKDSDWRRLVFLPLMKAQWPSTPDCDQEAVRIKKGWWLNYGRERVAADERGSTPIRQIKGFNPRLSAFICGSSSLD